MLFIDSIVILLNIATTYSIIPYLLFTYNRSVNTLCVFCFNVVFLFLRFGINLKIPKNDILFYLYIFIYLLNAIFGVYTDTFSIGLIVYLLLNISFYLILCNLFTNYNDKYSFDISSKLLVRGYIWLSIYNIVIILVMFILVTFLSFQPYANYIGDKMDLFESNLAMGSDIGYYFPNFISIIYKSGDIRIPFFQQYGFITGLYHEPHIVSFLLTPSFFILLDKFKKGIKRYIMILLYMLMMLISASTMNLIAFFICIIIYIIMKNRTKILMPMIILSIFGFLISFLNKNIFNFIIIKLTSESADYSASVLKFAFTPKTLLGTNIFNLSYIEANTNLKFDVGYILFFLNFLFLIICYYKLYYLIARSKFLYIGLFGLYFFLHSMKTAMLTYMFSYLLFIIFIMNIYINHSKIDKKNE